MSKPHLRVYSPNDTHTEDHDSSRSQSKRVRVPLRVMIPLLLDAAMTNRAWLEDFAEDTADIPQDLYEILLAYRRIADENREAA